MTFIRAAAVGVKAPKPRLLLTDARASRRAAASAEIAAVADADAVADAVAVADAMALRDAHTCGASLATTFNGPSWSLINEANMAIGSFRKLAAIADNCFTHMQLIVVAHPVARECTRFFRHSLPQSLLSEHRLAYRY
ncbi:MAG: hypothetical protein ABL921_18885 [Pirellula sp.]